MESAAITPTATIGTTTSIGGAGALSGDDFFQLLIAQLVNQDPLEPTSNQELLQQISSIREIELSGTLADSLKSLTDQQRYGSASALIGHYITGRPDSADPSGLRPEGVVVAVRFSTDGQAFLRLDNGLELSLEQLDTVLSPEAAAHALVGKLVSGLDPANPAAPTLIEGVVTGVRTES
ncbi:MAG TPA: flagellar hook capping FlgD N-terminal domain-containing protein, partial [Phycisphaerae bacterium]|nr:flagellar hook capping FlgD N-terminal domain-containing protein [Phycisphaerae bacterium]